MNVSGNALWERNERRIAKAALSLLTEGKGTVPTVSAICKRADVNRTTFYSHFRSVSDLIERYGRELGHHFQRSKQPQAFAWHTEKHLVLLMEHIRDHQDFYRASLIDYNRFFLGIDDPAEMEPLVESICTEKGLRAPGERELVLSFVIGGFKSIVTRWLEGGCEQSPAAIARVLAAFLDQPS